MREEYEMLEEYVEDVEEIQENEQPETVPQKAPQQLPEIFNKIADSDTIFIACIITLLLEEGCKDTLLLCVLGYLIIG